MSSPRTPTPDEFARSTETKYSKFFALWRRLLSAIETATETSARDLTSPYSRALEFLFLANYKSLCSTGVLCRQGLCEDAALSVRRLFEVGLQVEFIAMDNSRREEFAQRYLAYFWAYLHSSGMVTDQDWIATKFAECSHLVEFDRYGQPCNWWGGSVAQLARQLGRMDTYRSDYSWLSQAAHANLAGLSPDTLGARGINVLATGLVPPLLVFSSGYALVTFNRWNQHHEAVDANLLEALSKDVFALKAELRRSK